MRLRPYRRTLVAGSPRAITAGRHPDLRRARPSRIRRIRRRLGIGALLAVIGVRRFGRAVRARWEPAALLSGVLLVAGGYFVPGIGLFFPGLLVVTVTLLKGNSDRWRGARPARPAGPRPAELPTAASYRAAVYRMAMYRPPRCGEGHAPR